MVEQVLFAIDSDALVLTTLGSGSGQSVGNSIINNSDSPNGNRYLYTAGNGVNITIDDTGGDTDTFDDDDEANHVIIDGRGIVADGQEVEAESTILLQAVDPNTGLVTGPIITITVFSQGGVTSDVWGFSPSELLVDGTTYEKVGGDNNGDQDYVDFFICFEASTLIATQTGDRPANQIGVGDLVWTQGRGHLPIKWVGKTTIPASGKFAPIVFAPNAIGNPEELILSPEHRVLISDEQADLLFGTPEVLIAAKHLCGLPGVSRRDGGTVDYVHLMFDDHQIVKAGGVTCESFYLSEHSVAGLDVGARAELLELFPSLARGMDAFGDSAAVILKGFEAEALCDQLVQRRLTAA